MQSQNITRTLLFIIFFGIGAAAIGVSALCSDFATYYRNKHYLERAENLTNRLKSLNSDYNALLTQLDDDPNLIKRLAPAAIGADYTEPNTVHPKATAGELARAKKVLVELTETEPNEPLMPAWLERCKGPRRRMCLLLCGVGLVFLSFVCFSPRRPSAEHRRQK